MPLQEYKGYTVDYRLRQFRACEGGWENHGPITFIDFRSDEGDAILCEMIKDGVLDYSQYRP
jgi:hypothetical protein